MTRSAPTDLLEQGYATAARLTRQHGTTYYWGTALLAPEQRRDVYAVYALCRLADDIVDEPRPGTSPAQGLADFADRFRRILAAGPEGRDDAGEKEPVLAAVVHTVHRRRIDPECFDRFFAAMTLDLSRTGWASWPELRDGYMEGSAAVIGEMMLPVLEPLSDRAYAPARSLGLAFQLTNFLRDVGEDLDRGRVYLPADELAAHGADPHRRVVDDAWRGMMAAQIERNRELYRAAEEGVDLLPPRSARCVATAHRMYAEILRRIERADYDVFSARRRVPRARKLALAAEAVASPRRAVRRGHRPSTRAALDTGGAEHETRGDAGQ